jgi:hypothetical protein
MKFRKYIIIAVVGILIIILFVYLSIRNSEKIINIDINNASIQTLSQLKTKTNYDIWLPIQLIKYDSNSLLLANLTSKKIIEYNNDLSKTIKEFNLDSKVEGQITSVQYYNGTIYVASINIPENNQLITSKLTLFNYDSNKDELIYSKNIDTSTSSIYIRTIDFWNSSKRWAEVVNYNSANKIKDYNPDSTIILNGSLEMPLEMLDSTSKIFTEVYEQHNLSNFGSYIGTLTDISYFPNTFYKVNYIDGNYEVINLLNKTSRKDIHIPSSINDASIQFIRPVVLESTDSDAIVIYFNDETEKISIQRLVDDNREISLGVFNKTDLLSSFKIGNSIYYIVNVDNKFLLRKI